MNRLSERKLKILQLIIEEYISSGEPVGSRTISKNTELNLSAATIRNEMSDLEELGYLVQPYVSAGRVPSQNAYSLYVDELMQTEPIKHDEIDTIEEVLNSNICKIDDLLNETVKLLSNLTSYTSIAILNKETKRKKNLIKHFELVPISEYLVVMIIVMEDGKVHNDIINVGNSISKEKLDLISTSISGNIVGKTIYELGDTLSSYVKEEIHSYDVFFENIMKTLDKNIDNSGPLSIMLKGANNIFNYPEFNDIGIAKSFFTLIEDKNSLVDIVKTKGIEKDNVNIIIGDKSMGDLFDNYSILTANFDENDSSLAKIGIIGPRRMDYKKVFTLINYITKYLNDKLWKI